MFESNEKKIFISVHGVAGVLCFWLSDLDVAFENAEDREATRNFMDILAASESDGES